MPKAATIRAINKKVSTLPLVLAICAISAGLFFALAWAAHTRIPELVRASGQIGPLNDLARIDHFDGGVVQALFVDPGDTVKKGQLLAIITQPNLRAEIHSTEQTIATLERDRFRLDSVLRTLNAQAGAVTSDQNAPEADTALSAYIRSQDALFRARRETMQARIERLDLSVDAARAFQENALHRQELADANLEQSEELFTHGHISRTSLSERRIAAQEVRETVLEAQLQFLQSQDRVQEAEGQLIEAETAWKEELVAKLYDIDGQLSVLSVQLSEMMLRAERAELRSPHDGVIQTITADAVGQVVAPGGPVMDMLASDDELVAVVKLAPQDIGHVFVGAPVSIRPTTFDFRRFGDITGEVISISPTSQLDENQQPNFRTVIALGKTTIGRGQEQRALRAGMEVSADITTSDRTVLSYFFKSAERVLAVSLSER